LNHNARLEGNKILNVVLTWIVISRTGGSARIGKSMGSRWAAWSARRGWTVARSKRRIFRNMILCVRAWRMIPVRQTTIATRRWTSNAATYSTTINPGPITLIPSVYRHRIVINILSTAKTCMYAIPDPTPDTIVQMIQIAWIMSIYSTQNVPRF